MAWNDPALTLRINQSALPVTKRHLQILVLMSEGLENREIAQELHLSEETVKTHVKTMLARIPARNRTHAVSIGYMRGWLKVR